MRTRSKAPLVAVIAVLALGVPATGAIAAPADDVPIAEAGTILASDVPSTYSESAPMTSEVGVTPDTTSGSMERIARTIEQCRGFVDAFGSTPRGVTASADGASFDSDTAQASSSVLVFETAAKAEALYEPLSQPSLATCMNRMFEKSAQQSLDSAAGSGVKIDKMSAKVTRHPVAPVGDATADYQVRVHMKASQKAAGKTRHVSITMYADMQFVRIGRALAVYTFFAMGAPVDDVQEPAVAAATTRLTTALGG